MITSRKLTQGSSNLCEVCGTRPKHVDANGVTHSFCGRTCARNYTGVKSTGYPCKIRGCTKPQDPSFQGFCSEDHAKEGVIAGIVQGCIRCKVLPQSSGQRCEKCVKLPSQELRIWDINKSGTVWREFEREWKDRWRRGISATIEKLFEISYPPDVVAEKDKYQQSMASTGGVRTLRTFHASQCICDLGTQGPTLCSWKSCGICKIVQSAFKVVAFDVPYNKGRHGNGLYASSNPAVADIHATSCLSSPYRVMIACDVAIPDDMSKTDSILMGDRVVVRDPGAITPRYIVMYTK